MSGEIREKNIYVNGGRPPVVLDLAKRDASALNL